MIFDRPNSKTKRINTSQWSNAQNAQSGYISNSAAVSGEIDDEFAQATSIANPVSQSTVIAAQTQSQLLAQQQVQAGMRASTTPFMSAMQRYQQGYSAAENYGVTSLLEGASRVYERFEPIYEASYENASALVASNYQALQKVNMYANYGADSPMLRTQGEALANSFNVNFSSMKTAGWLMSDVNVLKYAGRAGLGFAFVGGVADILTAGSTTEQVKALVVDTAGIVGGIGGALAGGAAALGETIPTGGVGAIAAIPTVTGGIYLGSQIGTIGATWIWNNIAPKTQFIEEEFQKWMDL